MYEYAKVVSAAAGLQCVSMIRLSLSQASESAAVWLFLIVIPLSFVPSVTIAAVKTPWQPSAAGTAIRTSLIHARNMEIAIEYIVINFAPLAIAAGIILKALTTAFANDIIGDALSLLMRRHRNNSGNIARPNAEI